VANRARDEAKDIILDKLNEQGKITGDKKLIYEYDKMLRNPKVPDNLKGTYGTMIREQRPDIDVALNLAGSVTTVRSPEALTLLKEECDKRGIPFETMPAVLNMIEAPKETTPKTTTKKKATTKKSYALDSLPEGLR
jgi:hypothetical protein